MRFFRALAPLLLAPLGWVAAAAAELGSQLYDGLQWLYYLRVPLWLVEGEEQNSHLPLCVLCGLRQETKNYMLHQIFGDHYRQRYLGRYWLWNLARAIPATCGDCSLILVRTCAPHLKRFARARDWFLIPEWVLGEVSLPRDAAATRKVERDLRKIRRRGLGFELANDLPAFEDFYHNMYLPFATKTYGDCAYLVPYKYLRKIFPCSDLLLITKDGVSIAGQFIIYNQPGPCLLILGIRDADRAHVKDGASDAVYHYGLQFLEQKGFTAAWVGWTRPFLRDGVLKFKRKWSQTIAGGRFWGVGLRVVSLTAAVKSFLGNNPFIFRRDDLLHGAVFVDSDRPLAPEDVQQMAKDYVHAGLAGLDIYCLRPQIATISPPVAAAQLPERVQLRAWPQ